MRPTRSMEDCVRKRIAIAVMGALLLGGTATAALGAPKKSNGSAPNSYGHCTANYNGNKNVWLNQPNGVPPAFQGMLLGAEAYEALHNGSDNELSGGVSAEARLDIYTYCIALTNDGGLGI